MVSIPFIGGGKKRPPSEVYIGIFFKEQEGAVMYLEDTNAGLKILGTEHFSYSNGFGEQLVDDIDEALYRLETKTHLAPQKAIFFIYSHFIDHQHKEIKRAVLAKIKETTKSLELKPLGYIECQEAIIEHLKAREHAPLHMILLEFDRTVVTIALYQGGHNIHEQTIERRGDVINTLTPLFQELKQKYVLPNRLILYDEKSLTNDVSALLSNRWSEDIFPTPPKLDILTQDDLHKSLVDVFARQIHAQPLSSSGDDEATAGDRPPLSNVEKPPNELMGFMIGEDVSAVSDTDHQDTPAKKKGLSIGNPLKGFKIPRVRFPAANKVFPIAGLLLLLLLLGGLGAGEYLLHKAQVTVTFPSAPVSKTVTIDASLPLTEGSDSTKVEESAQTTGTRTVGEKAKGTVTIFNSNLQNRKSLAKGTELSGPNGLTFVLDDDVEVASASGDATQIKSSTAKVAALAGEIGTEYNISSGTKLSVEGESSSDVIAQADGAFTGGTKRQIRVVSANDIAKLQAAAAEEAKKNAAAALTANLGSGKVIVKDLTEVVLENEKLSRQVGAEAESVSLTANAKTTYYTYDESKLISAFNQELSKGLPSGTQVLAESVDFTIAKLENKDDAKQRVVTFSVKAKAVPRFDRSSLTSRITGKQVAALDRIVKDGFRAISTEVQNTPGIPPFTVFTPFIKKNITLEVVYQ
jgi:hypothetical protein